MTIEKIISVGDPVADLPSLISAVDGADLSQNSYDQTAQINFLRNFSIEPIEPFLKYHLYQAGIKPQIVFGDYDNVEQEILNPDSHLYKSAPDVIVLSLMLDQFDPGNRNPGWRADETREKLFGLLDQVVSKFSALIAVNTFLPPFHRELGIARTTQMADREEQILQLNQSVRQFALNHSARFVVMDWERLLRTLGEEESIDHRFWYSYKAPFKKKFLNLYALEIAKAARALKGKSKKCLVLDCDNTLWGGIVGETGLQGIQLTPNDYPGNVFYEFQKTVLQLIERGVMVTLCSKNNEADVWDVLDNHPHCLIKRNHLSGWRINWENKAENISSLAKELNIGLDALVFVEDNPVECEWVNNFLPEVTVLQVPKKLYSYPPLLLKEGWFDTLALSKEDSKRTALYQMEAQRTNHKQQFENIDDFLASLELTAHIHPMKEQEIPRVAQLTQKTNQFNLTTRRYSQSDVEQFAASTETEVFTLSVRDKFGDSGLTGVLIARHQEGLGVIDSLLMSCRILGRQLEIAFVDECFSQLEKKWNIEKWQAEYIPSKKNQQVQDFWDRLQFKNERNVDNQKFYSIQTKKRKPAQLPFIQIIRE